MNLTTLSQIVPLNLKVQNQCGKSSNVISFKSNTESANDSFINKNSYNETVNEIIKTIRSAKKVAIVTHSSPDGDAIGSTAAMKQLVASQKNVEKVEAFIVDGMNEGFKCLEDTESFKFINRHTPQEQLNEKFDLVIAVDCASKKMLKEGEIIFNNADKTIRIDHHASNENFAQINLVDENASAASQVIKGLAEPLGVNITPNIASDLYLALITDTGGFRYPNNPVKAFQDAADLAKTGIDVKEIYKNSMDLISKPLLELYRKALGNIKYSDDNSVAYCIDSNEFKNEYPPELKGRRRDISNLFGKITNLILPNIKDVKVGVMLREFSGGTTASLRGNNITVNDIAEKFGGGGHQFAAACQILKKPDEAIKDLMAVIKEKLKCSSEKNN